MVEIKIYRELQLSDMPALKLFATAPGNAELWKLLHLPANDFNQLIAANPKIWICEIDNRLVGLAVADTGEKNTQAIFVHPGFRRSGIDTGLSELVLKWQLSTSKQKDFTASKAVKH